MSWRRRSGDGPCRKCGARLGGDSELLRSAVIQAGRYVNGPLKARVEAGEVLDPEASGLAYMIQVIDARYRQVNGLPEGGVV